MFPKVWIRGYQLTLLLALTSCQLVTGLEGLELSGSGGIDGQSTGGAAATGGVDGVGGTSACLVGWRDDPCHEACGDPGDGILVGCGNFLDCYVTKSCLPATCSESLDDQCGINKIENGTSASLAMAEEVVACMCGSQP